MGEIPARLSTLTRQQFRGAAAGILVLMAIANTALAVRSFRLEERLERERFLVADLEERLRQGLERSALEAPARDRLRAAHGELSTARAELESTRLELAADLTRTRHRLAGVEDRLGAGRRVIARAARSVVFLQGSYGFADRLTGRPLRYAALGADGEPLTDESGNPLTTFEEAGPIVEEIFMGSAFVAAPGLLLTNRHVARPWESEVGIADSRLEPLIQRFAAFAAGSAEAVPVTVAAVSDSADLAVLRATGLEGVQPIPLAAARPHAGDEVLLLGYPTGLAALIARADDGLLDQLFGDDLLDGWTLVERLAEHGAVAPLATRGIVGHIDRASIIYDAETASGGSGGPLLNLAGQAVAVNAALLPQFGGSNIGVPIAEARRLLDDLENPAPPTAEPAATSGTQVAAVVPGPAATCPAPAFCDSVPVVFPLP